VITAGFNQAYNVAVSDVDNTNITSVEAGHRDHTSDSSRFHKFDAPNEQSQTWQHERNASTSRSDLRLGVDVSIGSTTNRNNNLLEDYDDVVTTHTHDRDYPHIYTDLTDEARSHDYYQNPDATVTQEGGMKEPTSDYAHNIITDDGEYIYNGMEKGHTSDAQTDSHLHTYSNDTERIHQGSTRHHDYESICYCKLSVTQDEESTSKQVNFDDGKYCGAAAVPKQREKAQPGKHA
jgi:hypothetical protein